jgi:hypothetical protein
MPQGWDGNKYVDPMTGEVKKNLTARETMDLIIAYGSQPTPYVPIRTSRAAEAATSPDFPKSIG